MTLPRRSDTPDLISTIISDDVIKWAYNAQFERICLSEWLKRKGIV